jgi:hypothetical protein
MPQLDIVTFPSLILLTAFFLVIVYYLTLNYLIPDNATVLKFNFKLNNFKNNTNLLVLSTIKKS